MPLILTSVQAIPDTGAAYTLCLPATGYANISFDPLGGGGHFDTLQVVHLDAADDTVTRCGDLTFANQVHTFDFTLVNSCEDNLCPYLYWWRGSRSRSTGQYATTSLWDGALEEHDTVEVEDRQMPLGTQYDGVGAILLKSTSACTATDSAFLGLGAYGHDIQYRIQYWRHVDSLVMDSATVNGYVVTLWWQNRHQGRAIDSTIIFRDGDERIRLDHTADSLSDTVPGPATYLYRLKHFSTAVVGGADLASPNSRPWTLQVTVPDTTPPPAPPTVTISGPTYISKPGNYAWTANVSGGLPPYTYQWWYRLLSGGPWQQLTGETNPSYTRYVGYSQWAFRLRADVTDSLGLADSGAVVVDVPWGARIITEPADR